MGNDDLWICTVAGVIVGAFCHLFGAQTDVSMLIGAMAAVVLFFLFGV